MALDIDHYVRTATEKEIFSLLHQKVSHCSVCENPCGVIHDFEISKCHHAPVVFKEAK